MALTLTDVHERIAGEGDEQLTRFAAALLGKADEALLTMHDADGFRDMAAAGLAFLAELGTDELSVKVFNPGEVPAGWTANYTVAMLALADRPFIVDSVQAEIRRQGHQLFHQLHPILQVSRAADGSVTALGAADGHTEAFEIFFIERVDSEASRERLRSGIVDVLSDVILATDDYRAMLDLSVEVEEYLGDLAERAKNHDIGLSGDEVSEDAAFMEWLDDDNFVFLGYRGYDIVEVSGVRSLQVTAGSGLGVLRKVDSSAYQQPVPLEQLPAGLRERVTGGRLFIVTKANAEATVHRARRMDYIGVKKLDDKGEVVGEQRFIGLFTTQALNAPVGAIPILRHKLRQVLDLDNAIPGSHDYKAIVAVFNTMPREELFWSDAEQIHRDIRTVLRLEQEQIVRLTLRHDPLKRGVAAMVIMPRESFSDEVRRKIQDYLAERLGATSVDSRIALGEDESHARFHYFFATAQLPDDALVAELEVEVQRLARGWAQELRELLLELHGEEAGSTLAARYIATFDDRYRANIPPGRAVIDVANFEQLEVTPHVIDLVAGEAGQATLLIYHLDHGQALSDVLPLLENLGFRVFEQNPYNLTIDGKHSGMDVYTVSNSLGGDIDVGEHRERLVAALSALLAGQAENDRLNRLVLHASLTSRQVALLRAYAMYYAQISVTTSRAFVFDALLAHPHIAALLLRYFETRFDPNFGGEVSTRPSEERLAAATALHQEVLDALSEVRSLAEDQVLRGLLDLVAATVRSNYFLELGRISLKIKSELVAKMPEPRPMFEIAVSGRGVDGTHLRGGLVARGGIRWSDRPDDFRTEVLGLLKTQTTKNAVIVPVGSKGGFVIKNAPAGGDLRDYVREQYQTYIRALLDITDNLVDGAVVHPEGVVIYDDADPYLVVAADKGTAAFSDLANATAGDYGFWLGDAFASGGSAGYDHKGMGITARGAFEATKRHMAEEGVDIFTDTFTVAGIGDMSGDVFGNGMRYTDRIRLQAAFNHLHVFIDPDPDPDSGFAERERLYHKPRSAWTDYDPALISAGGGVFERASKSIPLSDEMRAMLDVTDAELSGQELIKAVLCMPVDLLYNGGIGTYVKSSEERNAEVGDSANDGVRVSGNELRAKVVVEGGNLGFTQLGRIEYALAGGRIDTDAIDNSAGVDTSDHEVNIKILLQPLVASGELGEEARNELLKEMTDEVAALVLSHNYQQTRALSLAQRASQRDPGLYVSLLDYLVESSGLDPEVEFLPSAKQLEERRLNGVGLTRPELAIMLAYVKMGLYRRLLETDLPNEESLQHYVVEYFPSQLGERYLGVIAGHQLKREITATVLTNTLVDQLGLAFVHRAMRDNGASPIEVVRATLVALEVLDTRVFTGKIDAAAGQLSAEAQYRALGEMVGAVEGVVSWMLFNAVAHDDLTKAVNQYREPLRALRAGLHEQLPDAERERFVVHAAELAQEGFDEAGATEIASLDYLPSSFGVIEVARAAGVELEEAAVAFFAIGERLSLGWLRDNLSQLPGSGPWEKTALMGLVMDLRDVQQRLTTSYLRSAQRGAMMADEFATTLAGVRRFDKALPRLREPGNLDLASGAVLVRMLEFAATASEGAA